MRYFICDSVVDLRCDRWSKYLDIWPRAMFNGSSGGATERGKLQTRFVLQILPRESASEASGPAPDCRQYQFKELI